MSKLFGNAKTLTNAAPTAKGKKKEREVIDMANVERLAHLDAVIKAATAAKAALEGTLTETVRELFMERIGPEGQKPESFNLAEGLAEVNCQLKKRSSMSALNDEEREILTNAKIPFHHEIITPELFAINPAYAEDAQMLDKVEKALGRLGLPEDFIVKQEQKSKYVIDEVSLDQALRSKDSEIVQIATTLAFKPTLSELVPGDIAKTVASILDIPAEEPAAAKPVAKVAKKPGREKTVK